MTDPLATHTHRFIPAADPRQAPTLLMLHGTGGDEHDLIPLAGQLLPGANVLSPRGNVSENGAPRFFRRLAEGVFDLDDLRLRTTALADFIRTAVDAYAIDQSRLVAVGFSNGANIAASVLLAEGALFPYAILIRAMVPFEPDTKVSLDGAKVLLSSGRADPLIRPENTERLAVLLSERGANVTLEWLDAGHGLTQSDATIAKAELSRWLA